MTTTDASLKEVTLQGTNLTTTRLGFGCASLMRLTSATERQRVLETAFDSGIRHFDVARMYGLGKAESVLGEFTRSRRDQVTITTKFGIQLNQLATKLGSIQVIARRLAALSPGIRKFLRRRSESLYNAQTFRIEEARQSLETSLTELRTDHIDLFMLHECAANSVNGEELLAFLEDAVKAGKVRYYGISTNFPNTLEMCARYPELTRIVQFESDIVSRNIERLPGASQRALVTHRTIAQGMELVQKHFAADPGAKKRWADRTGLDCTKSSVLTEVMMNYSLLANPEGIVLFGSTTPAHIAANVQSVRTPSISPAAIQAFAELVKAEIKLNA